MKAIYKKWNYGFKNIKYFLGTHLRDASGFPSDRNVEAFFGPFRLNLYHFRVDSGEPRMKVIFEKTIFSFPKMKAYLDKHLRVLHVVLIVGEDV
jgi:hypothetical protein